VFFPPQPWSVNYFGTLGGSGATRLHVTPVQHRSQSPEMTRRVFTNMNFRLFYSANTASYCGDRTNPDTPPCANGATPVTPALAAPPSITGVDTSITGGIRSIGAHVIGDPVAGIQQVLATYTVDGSGVWQSIVLEQDDDDATLWTGELPSGTPATLSFMIQAVNGVGKVTLDNNFGAFYRPGSIPGPPDPDADPPATTTLTFTDAPPSTVRYREPFDVAVRLTAAAGCPVAGKLIRVGIGGAGLPVSTNGSGDTPAIALSASLAPGTYVVTASFAGTASCAPSDVSVPITVVQQPTSLALAFPFVTLTATTAPPTPLFDRTVIITVTQGAVVRSHVGRTDPQGRVQVPASLLAGLAQGAHTVRAEYAGEIGYGPATVSGSTLNVIRRGSGSDRITGTEGDDLIIDTGGSNTIDGRGGNDTIIVSGSGSDKITGGNGHDTIDAGGGSNVVDGGAGDDMITTGSGSDTIDGGSGNDVIHAGDGSNKVNAGTGDDMITTGSGSDTIDGGPGFDFCNAGGGSNTVRNCEG
jgi:Ca2+-binding RTX toxin-like protein